LLSSILFIDQLLSLREQAEQARFFPGVQ
jgi:hypothetical protein